MDFQNPLSSKNQTSKGLINKGGVTMQPGGIRPSKKQAKPHTKHYGGFESLESPKDENLSSVPRGTRIKKNMHIQNTMKAS